MGGCTPQEGKTLKAFQRGWGPFIGPAEKSSLPAYGKHTATLGASRGGAWQSSLLLTNLSKCHGAVMFSIVCSTCACYLPLLISLHLRMTWKIWDSGVQVEFCKLGSTCLHLCLQPRQSAVRFGPDKTQAFSSECSLTCLR